MNKTIIGIDPDSEAHGVAIYTFGKLERLESWGLIRIFHHLQRKISLYPEMEVEIHMENVCAQNQTFTKKGINNQASAKNVARSIGKCQQSQIEIERVFRHLGIKVVLHPISKNWKATNLGKKALLHYTGWSGRSNEDTRSAAYFGWLGCKSNGIQ